MRRALVLFLVFLAASVAAGPAAAAPPRHGAYLELHDDGFLMQASSNLGSGRIRLLLDRHGAVAYYTVAVRVGTRTVKARFGHLGRIDLRFTPDRDEGPVGCGGERGWQHGTFRGAIVFHGEHHYAHVDATRARGWFQTRPSNGCAGSSHGGDATARSHGSEPVGSRWKGAVATGAAGAATASRAAAVAETGVDIEGTTASSPPATYFYFYTENHSAGIRTNFDAFREEKREGMQIIRGAQVYGGAAALRWDLGAGTATVEPPAPFTGRAFLRREPGGHSRWWGSLRAPILGGRPVRLTGASFGTTLGPNT